MASKVLVQPPRLWMRSAAVRKEPSKRVAGRILSEWGDGLTHSSRPLHQLCDALQSPLIDPAATYPSPIR